MLTSITGLLVQATRVVLAVSFLLHPSFVSLTRAVTSAQEREAPSQRFNLGDIPGQRAWYGHDLKFFVSSPLRGPVQFTVEFTKRPVGNVSLDLNSGEFSFRPSREDTLPFTATFKVTRGNITRQQEVLITPAFKPEYSYFKPSGVKPASSDSRYVQITEATETLDENSYFNAQNKRVVRDVVIAGRELIFENNQRVSTLYESYNARPDIRKLTLVAESVIVRDRLSLPQTEVVVYAKDLIFEDRREAATASIDTTPLPWTTNADSVTALIERGKPATQGEPGRPGHKAGDITLFVGAVITKAPPVIADPRRGPSVKRFILNGGTGQKGGAGVNGKQGPSLRFENNYGYNGIVFIREDHGGGRVNPWFGTQDWPGPGENAKPAGRSGDGGPGGHFKSTTDVRDRLLVEQNGGVPGARGEEHQGGPPGDPNPAVWLNRTQGRCIVEVDGPGRTRCARYAYNFNYLLILGHPASPKYGERGQNAPAPSQADQGKPGEGTFARLADKPLAWLHPLALRSVIGHAKDLYINGHLDDARTTLEFYNNLLTQSAPGSFQDEFASALGQQEIEVETLLHRLASNLDYFGNPAGFVPRLSLDTNITLYQNEIRDAFQILYMVYWLKQKASDVKAKVAALDLGVRKLRADAETDAEKFNALHGRVGPLRQQAADLENRASALLPTLQAKERALEEKVRANHAEQHKLPSWKKALRTLALVSKFSPVYQPALGGVGLGLETLSQINENTSIQENLGRLETVASKLTAVKMQESANDLKRKYEELRDAADEGQFAARLLPSAKKVAEMQHAIRTSTAPAQAPQKEIEAELQRIKNEDEDFRKLATEVESLTIAQRALQQKAVEDLQAITNLSERIAHNLLTIDTMKVEKSSKLTALAPQTVMYLDEVSRRAEERLLKYNYYVAKSYEYQLLKPYPGLIKLTDQFKQLLQLASLSDTSNHPSVMLTEDEFKRLAGVYEEQVSQIAFEAIEIFERGRPLSQSSYPYKLSPAELEQLSTKGEVVLNLERIGMLFLREDDQRLVSVRVCDDRPACFSARTADGRPPGDNMTLDLLIQPSLRSLVREGLGSYMFTFPSEPVWQYKYNLRRQRVVSEATLGGMDQALLNHLMRNARNRRNDEKVNLYAYPSIRGDLKISTEVIPDKNVPVVIDGLELIFTYTHRVRTDKELVTLTVQTPQGASPHILVSKMDEAGLADGSGDFTRTYKAGAVVTLNAPATYGQLKFIEWRQSGIWNGNEVEEGVSLGASNEVEVKVRENMVVQAVYR